MSTPETPLPGLEQAATVVEDTAAVAADVSGAYAQLRADLEAARQVFVAAVDAAHTAYLAIAGRATGTAQAAPAGQETPA